MISAYILAVIFAVIILGLLLQAIETIHRFFWKTYGFIWMCKYNRQRKKEKQAK